MRELGRPVIGEYLTGANGIRAVRAVVDTTSDADVVLFETSSIANRAARRGVAPYPSSTRLSRWMSSGSSTQPRIASICDDGWRRMRAVSAAP